MKNPFKLKRYLHAIIESHNMAESFRILPNHIKYISQMMQSKFYEYKSKKLILQIKMTRQKKLSSIAYTVHSHTVRFDGFMSGLE